MSFFFTKSTTPFPDGATPLPPCPFTVHIVDIYTAQTEDKHIQSHEQLEKGVFKELAFPAGLGGINFSSFLRRMPSGLKRPTSPWETRALLLTATA